MRIVHGPGHAGFNPVAGSCQQGANFFDGETETNGRGKGVGGSLEGQSLLPRIRDCGRNSTEGTDPGEQRMVHHRQIQKPCRVTSHHGPVESDQEQTGSNNRREKGDDAEIPKLIWIQACALRGAQQQRQAGEHAQRGHEAIRRNNQWTDVEENRIHVREEYLLGGEGE